MNGERDSLRPDDQAAGLSYPGHGAGIFDAGRNAEDPAGLQDPVSTSSIPEELLLDAPKEETPEERNPVRARRALRRLQNGPPSEFEQIIDLLYEWREHSPRAQVTEVMRTLMTRNHNMDDRSSIKMMRNLIQEARKAKIDEAVAKLGLDEAERVLGLKSDPEDK